MSASVSPRPQARRSGPTVIFPSGRYDRPRLWPALSLAVGACVGLVVLSARLSTGGIPRRPARTAPPSVPAVPDPLANELFEPEVTIAPVRSEAWTTPAARSTAGRMPTRAATPAAARAPVRASADGRPDREREAIEREDAAALAVAPPPAAAPAPQPPPVASLPPARLFVSSQPWGRLYIDGQLIGNTPLLNIPVTPGRHRIRVSRDGYTSFDTTIAALPETMMRLTGITLREWTP